MLDAQTYALLQEIIRRESRSFLQYVADSFPWATAEESTAVAKLQQMIKEERQAIGDLVRLLARHRLTPPYLGAFPVAFTTSNFVSLHHLVPRLLEEERRAVTLLEKDVAAVRDPEARRLIENIVAMKQRHLHTLQGKAVAEPQTAAVH